MYLVRSGGLQGYPQLVRSMGCSPVELLNCVGLNLSALHRPDTYLPYEKVAELLTLSAEVCDEELFGLKLATHQGRKTLGVLGLFISNQASIGKGLEMSQRFIHFHASGVALNRVDMGRFSLFKLVLDLPESLDLDQLRQLSIGLVYRLVQRLAGESWHPLKILFRQIQPSTGLREMERFFSCTVSCASELDGMMIENHILARPPAASADQMKGFLDEHIRSMENDFPDSIVDQTRHTISSLLPISECTLDNVAKLLDLHPRILQRRLSKQGTGFQPLIDETRLNIAKNSLRHSNASLTDLALNLGFAELSVFSRAFKRWTGASPSEWRLKGTIHPDYP